MTATAIFALSSQAPPSPGRVLQPVPGFESTAYAYLNGKIVWAGQTAVSDHPRNAVNPWQPPPLVCDAACLKAGAITCLGLFGQTPLAKIQGKGLLTWLVGLRLPFPLFFAAPRFDAIRAALEDGNIDALEHAALRVLGLGDGLTPSGDDFVGGIFFALAHAPRPAWQAQFAQLKMRIRAAALPSTNAISAALLDDLMDGASHRALHDMLVALQSNDAARMEAAGRDLMRVGATSGADMLAGLLLALLTLNIEN